MQPCPARARSNWGDGSLGRVQFAADVPAGIAGGRGRFAALFLEAGIPALLRKGAVEAVGGRLAFASNALMLAEMGVAAPLKVSGAGRYVLRAASRGKERGKSVRGPNHSVSQYKWGARTFPAAVCAFLRRG